MNKQHVFATAAVIAVSVMLYMAGSAYLEIQTWPESEYRDMLIGKILQAVAAGLVAGVLCILTSPVKVLRRVGFAWLIDDDGPPKEANTAKKETADV